MKKIFQLLIIVLCMSACSSQNEQFELIVDMNGTIQSPIVLASLSNQSNIDTLYIGDDKLYHSDITNCEYGFYQLKIDSINNIDVVFDKTNPILINARYNYLDEVTTNSKETNTLIRVRRVLKDLYTQIDLLKKKSINKEITFSNQKDSVNILYSLTKTKFDKILQDIDTSIVAALILNSGYGDQKIYNVISDYQVFEQYSKMLLKKYPENKYVRQYSRMVENAQSLALFVQANKVGDKAMSRQIRKNDNSIVSTQISNENPYIFYYSSDTISRSASIMRLTVWYRSQGNKVFVAEANPEELLPKNNFYNGKLIDNGDMSEMSMLSPLLIQVGADGLIKKIIIGATLNDVNSVL